VWEGDRAKSRSLDLIEALKLNAEIGFNPRSAQRYCTQVTSFQAAHCTLKTVSSRKLTAHVKAAG
jgi:hypothetical protein